MDPSLALLTDLYQLTMAYGYWKRQLHKTEAVFHLFFRRTPFQGGFTIAAGLEPLLRALERVCFGREELEYLASLQTPSGAPLFETAFLQMLSTLHIESEIAIDAVPEGTVVFPFEPLVRVQGPLLQVQFLETLFLNQINFASLIATKAARMVLAAGGDRVIEFGLRRAQGMDGALTASRSAYIGGCDATSNVLAGKMFQIPVSGTHAHSWVLTCENEREAFRSYAKALPENTIFLVDTYDTLQGVMEAIEVGRELRAEGKKLLGIRLDSGDLAQPSRQARAQLDAAGFQETHIVASNDLGEWAITDLKRQGAPIHVWGVGTRLVTGGECSSLDGVYKLSALRDGPDAPWRDCLKLSEQMVKISNPGILQVRRYFSEGEAVADVLYDTQCGVESKASMVDLLDSTQRKELLSTWTSRELLIPIMRKGVLVASHPPLEQVRAYAQEQLKQFSYSVKQLTSPQRYPVGMESRLYEKKINLVTRLRQQPRGRENMPREECKPV